MLSCAAVVGFCAEGAFAQAADASESKVAEIIVTAQKRSENIQNVPVSVTALNSAQLDKANVESVIDLKLVAPALNSVASNGIYLANSIRGVGSFGYGGGIESPVGLYVDGVYQASPFLFSVQLNSIAAVEVLKGPQGTLFGRNATGGLINIKTLDPSTKPTGNFSLGYGNYNTLSGNAYLAGGLTENLSADIAFVGKAQGDGFGKNITTGQDWNRLDHDFAVRSKWKWTPDADTSLTLVGDYFEGKGTAGGGVDWPGKLSGFVPGRIAPDLGYGTDVNKQIERQISGGGASLQIEHRFSGVMFKSTSAYRKSTYPLAQDIDFTPLPLATLTYRQGDRQISQEFQLTSDNKSKFKWTAGLFYFDAKSVVNTLVDLSGLAGVQLYFYDTVGTRSGAAYGQGTYEIAENTNFTVGARFTSEKRTETGASSPVVIVAINATIPQTYPDRSFTKNELTWRASLDHRFSSDVMGYISVNTGFKSGGFNSTLPGTSPYLNEKLTAYEAGLKTDLLDRHLRLNLAGFYYDYQNIQVQALQGSSLIILNGPSAKIYGLDADFTAALTDGLKFAGGVNWISPKFGNFANCPVSSPAGGVPVVAVGTSCNGNQVPMAAKFTFSGSLNYSKPVGDGHVDVGTNLYYNSGLYFESDNVLRQNRYAMLGASAKYTLGNGFSAEVWGKNLTNIRVAGYATTQTSGNAVVNYQDPRTYGVTLGYRF